MRYFSLLHCIFSRKRIHELINRGLLAGMIKVKEYTEEELNRIISTYTNSLVRLAFTYTKNVPDAEDVVQEVMIRLMTKKPWFENENHEKAWLIRVTINTSINYIKAVKRRKAEPLSYDIPDMTREEGFLLESIDALPEKYKSVLYLYYYEGYQIKDLSQILQKPESTISTWLSRARKRLKVQLEKEGDIWNI